MRPIVSFGRKILRQWLHDSAGLQEGWISPKKNGGFLRPGMVIIITHVLLVWKVYHTFTIDFSQNHPICRKLFHALSTWGSLEHIWVFVAFF